MKYLINFNESRQLTYSDNKIKDFCEIRLVYLMDDDYQIDYQITDDIIQRRQFIIDIRLTKPDTLVKYFTWNNVKDTIIPLVEQLNKRYIVEVEIFDGNYDDKRHHTVDWVIADGPSRWFAPNTIRFIKIKLKGYLFGKSKV